MEKVVLNVNVDERPKYLAEVLKKSINKECNRYHSWWEFL